MKPMCQSHQSRQNGLTLVELMVAITIGLFIVGAISTLYVKMRGSFDYLEEVSRMQETGRFGLEIMSRDIRMAGYNGCGTISLPVVNVINGATSNPLLDFSKPIRGYEGGVSSMPSGMTTADTSGDSPSSGTDAIILLGVDTSNELVVQGHNPNSAQIDTNTHSIKPGAVLLITDCSKASIFQMTGPTNNNNNASNVVHNTGTESPGNCYKQLGKSCGTGALNYTYKPGSSLLQVYSNAYFVAPSKRVTGSRALWTRALQGTTTGVSEPRELLVGVEDMQISYGIYSSAIGNTDRYVTADIVESEGKWDKVSTVRISLLVRSSRNHIATGNQTYRINSTPGSIADNEVIPDDKILRKVFSETVVARNRTL